MGHARRPPWVAPQRGGEQGAARPERSERASPVQTARDGARGVAGVEEDAAGAGAGALAGGLWGATGEPIAAPAPRLHEAPPSLALRRAEGAGRGKRRAVASDAPFRGRASGARPAGERLRDIAWSATLRAAAGRSAHARATAPGRLALATHELFAHVRRRRPEQLLLFVVDTSGSMGGVLTGHARAMATAALRDAYLKRATVALVVFRERAAELVLPATRKVDRLHAALDALGFGGTTPLAAALELARRTVVRRRRDATTEPTLVLISDGRANVGSRPGHERILAEVSANARALAALRGLSILFLDTTEDGKDDAPARALASWLGAERVALSGAAGPPSSREQA